MPHKIGELKDMFRKMPKESNEEIFKAVSDIFKIIFLDVEEIAKARKVTKNEAVKAVLREQDQKWRSLAQEFPSYLNPNGFKEMWNKNEKDPRCHI